jgi:hypothetical protein
MMRKDSLLVEVSYNVTVCMVVLIVLALLD